MMMPPPILLVPSSRQATHPEPVSQRPHPFTGTRLHGALCCILPLLSPDTLPKGHPH